jgi:ribosomal protein L28
MARCDVCGKGRPSAATSPSLGALGTQGPATNRTFKANVQKKTFVIDGQSLRLNVCTRCLRTQLKVSA